MKKLIILTAFAIAIISCSSDKEGGSEPVIPVSLKGIEAVNIDNSGEFPAASALPIKKDAYMVGIKWVADNTPTDDDNKFITGPIQKGQQTYNSIADRYSKAIKSNSRFNADIPPGKYISKFFKEIDREYLPADINEGFVLLVAPDPGPHSFTVEYYLGHQLKFSYNTSVIEFF